MGTERLDRLYERLDAEERFQMLLAAQARGDLREAERLAATCPMVPMLVADPGVTRMAEAAARLSFAFEAQATFFLGWLDLVGWVEESVLAAMESRGIPVGEAARFADLSPAEVALCSLWGARDLAATGLRTLIEALGEVCREELGAEPDAFLTAPGGNVRAGLERHRGLIEEAPIHEARYAADVEALTRAVREW